MLSYLTLSIFSLILGTTTAAPSAPLFLRDPNKNFCTSAPDPSAGSSLGVPNQSIFTMQVDNSKGFTEDNVAGDNCGKHYFDDLKLDCAPSIKKVDCTVAADGVTLTMKFSLNSDGCTNPEAVNGGIAGAGIEGAVESASKNSAFLTCKS